MAGMLDLVAIDGPDRPAGQFGELLEPVPRLEEPVKEFIRTGGDFGHQVGPTAGMESAEPGGPGEILAVLLPGLQKVAAGIPVAEHPPQGLPHETLVAERRRVPPMPAIMAEQAEGGFKESLVDREVFQGLFHVSIISIRTPFGENETEDKPPHRRRPVRFTDLARKRSQSPSRVEQMRTGSPQCPTKAGWRGREFLVLANL